MAASGRLCEWLQGDGGAEDAGLELMALRALAACVTAAREGAAPRAAAPAEALRVGAAAALRGARQGVGAAPAAGCEQCGLGWQVLGAALAARGAEGGAPPPDAVAAAVEALAALLPPGPRGKKLGEGAPYARVYAGALKTAAHLVELGGDLSVQQVQAVVASCAKCFKYAAPGPAGAPPASPALKRAAPEAAAAAAAAAAAEGAAGRAAKRGGYVPPHKRGGSRGGSDSEFSDSDASDGERGGGAGASVWLPAARARAAAVHCLAALARHAPKSLQAHWATLLPSPSSLQPSPYSPNLGTVMLHDPSAHVRAAAWACTSAMLDGARQKAFVAVAEVPKKKSALRGFTTLSVALGQCLMGLQAASLAALQDEADPLVLAQAFKGVGVLSSQAPVDRLPDAFLPQLAAGALERLQRLHDLPGGELAATAGALGCLAAVCGTKAPVPGLQGALLSAGPGPAACARVPGAAVALACDEEGALALRSEAFGVLQSLARNYPASIAEAWDRVQACVLRSLERPAEGAPAARPAAPPGKAPASRGAHGATVEKLAQQGLKALTARLQGLAGDACLGGHEEAGGAAAGGAGALPGALGALNIGEEAAPAPPPQLGGEYVRLVEGYAERPLRVASGHRSAMVRAAGFGVVSGSCSPLFGGVSGGVVATLVGRAGEAMRRDDTPSVRAAACKVIGSLACVPPLATQRAELMQLGQRLLASSGDSSLSVRVPLAWSLANICDSFRVSASGASGRVLARDVHPLAEGCLALCRDNDKVRANATRALGYLLSCCHFEDGDARSVAWLDAGVECLLASLSSGNVKVQWNCCYALGSLMENRSLMASPRASDFAPRILQSLLGLVGRSANYKIRTHASAALTVPRSRGEYFGLLEEVVAGLYDTLAALEGGQGDGGSGDPGRPGTGQDFRNRQALQMQLYATLLHAVALLEVREEGGAGDGPDAPGAGPAHALLLCRAPGLARVIHTAHEQASANAAAQVSEDAVAHLELSPKSTPSKYSLNSGGSSSPRAQDKQGPVAVHAVSSPGSAQKPLSFGVRDTRGAARALAGWVNEFHPAEGSAAEARGLLDACL